MSASGETKGALAPIEMIVEAFFLLSEVEVAEDGVDVRAAGVGLSSQVFNTASTASLSAKRVMAEVLKTAASVAGM